MSMHADERLRVEIEDPAALRAWLLEHHAQDDSVWLVTYKKQNPERYVSTEDILDELVAFGWTDGVRRKLDDDRTMQVISPRRTQYWAKSYKDRAARLIDDGRMHEAGLASIERSKASGTWDFMDDVDALVVPPDLAAALEERPPARENYEAFPDSSKRNTLRWIKLARTETTRAARIIETATRAAANQRVPNA